jgi:hypothetical protein
MDGSPANADSCKTPLSKSEGLNIGESSESATGKKGSSQATGPFAKAKFKPMMTTELETDGQTRDGVRGEVNCRGCDSRWSYRRPNKAFRYVDRTPYTEEVDITPRIEEVDSTPGITRRGNPGRSGGISSEWYETRPPCCANEENQGLTKPSNS